MKAPNQNSWEEKSAADLIWPHLKKPETELSGEVDGSYEQQGGLMRKIAVESKRSVTSDEADLLAGHNGLNQSVGDFSCHGRECGATDGTLADQEISRKTYDDLREGADTFFFNNPVTPPALAAAAKLIGAARGLEIIDTLNTIAEIAEKVLPQLQSGMESAKEKGEALSGQIVKGIEGIYGVPRQ